ncbi:MAG TPA: DUF4097 family beta strand repeat-containing protein [Mucilaginibacter sp.]|nr:DUF4097 family beta strand repeat-containing protein [Mucilaginibacter sp.]
MKTIFTLLVATCVGLGAFAQDEHTPYLTKSLANDGINNVMVSTSAGGITVSGRSGEAPRVEVYIKGNNGHDLTKEQIEKRLAEQYDMDISVNAHKLTATVKRKHEMTDWHESLSISFKIYVPEETSTDLHTSGGGIALDNLKGTETFSTSGGGLELDKLTGTIRGKTSGGGIEVSNCSNDIDLHTSGGGIDARNCEGQIRLVTSGGGLELDDLKGTIYAHTSGGGVDGNHIEGELTTGTSGGSIDLKDMACSLDANTSAGSLRAQMRAMGKYLRLHTSAGDIELEIPAKQGLDLDLSAERISDNMLTNFTGTWDKRHVMGSVNGGGIPVEARASSGDIDVRVR